MIKGRVLSEGFPLESVTVDNISQLKITRTDSMGSFSLRARLGDTLLFAEKNVVPKRLILGQEELRESELIIELDAIVNQLDEALVYANSKINAVDLGIIPKEIKLLTNNEKQLHTAGDFKYIHLLGLLGGHLAVDPIINKISGKTARLKKTIAAERVALNYQRIKETCGDFITENLKVPERDRGRFLYFLADNAATLPLMEQKDENALQFFIAQQWVVFQNREDWNSKFKIQNSEF